MTSESQWAQVPMHQDATPSSLGTESIPEMATTFSSEGQNPNNTPASQIPYPPPFLFPQQQQQQQPSIPATPNFAPKEYGINKPTPFTGDRTRIETFVQECLVYLTINRRVYDTDESRVGFMLSLMTDKEARSWKELFIKKMVDTVTGDMRFPTTKNFVDELRAAFKMEDLTETAINKLALLKQGSRTAEELVTEFRFLAGQAQLETKSHSDNIHMIRLFRAALRPQLANKILFGDPVPGTIEDWFTRAIRLDSNYRMAMAITGKTPNRNGYDKGQNRNWSHRANEQKDPNAMDIDFMTTEERATLMRQGLCFRCKKRGHLARDCNEKVEQKKWSLKDLKTGIQALTKEEFDELKKETADF
jgi:hypothetical protein